MFNVNELKTDENLENEGARMALPGDAWILVARHMNPAMRAKIAELLAPYEMLVASGDVPKETLRRITVEAMSETIVKGWHNISTDGKKAMKFTLPNVVKTLNDVPEILERVSAFSQTFDNYRAKAEGEAVKN